MRVVRMNKLVIPKRQSYVPNIHQTFLKEYGTLTQ